MQNSFLLLAVLLAASSACPVLAQVTVNPGALDPNAPRPTPAPAPRPAPARPAAKPAQQAASAKGTGLLGAYISTFLLTVTNPMTILSFAAIFAGKSPSCTV